MREETKARQATSFQCAAQKVSVEVVAGSVVGGQKSHCHRVASCGYRRQHFKVTVATLLCIVPVKFLHQLIVHQNLQLLSGNFAKGIVAAHVAFADGPNIEPIVCVNGKFMCGQQTTACAKGHAFDIVVLAGVFGHSIGCGYRSVYAAKSDATDFASSRHIAFQQCWAYCESSSHIVESSGAVIAGQILCWIDLQVQEVSDHIGIFCAVEPMDSRWCKLRLCGGVQAFFQVLDPGFHSGSSWSGHARRRHHACSHLANHQFPLFR